jgi:hypothetical protein
MTVIEAMGPRLHFCGVCGHSAGQALSVNHTTAVSMQYVDCLIMATRHGNPIAQSPDYVQENSMIPRNSSVLVKRVPAVKARGRRRESQQQPDASAPSGVCHAMPTFYLVVSELVDRALWPCFRLLSAEAVFGSFFALHANVNSLRLLSSPCVLNG